MPPLPAVPPVPTAPALPAVPPVSAPADPPVVPPLPRRFEADSLDSDEHAVVARSVTAVANMNRFKCSMGFSVSWWLVPRVPSMPGDGSGPREVLGFLNSINRARSPERTGRPRGTKEDHLRHGRAVAMRELRSELQNDPCIRERSPRAHDARAIREM